MEKRTVVSQEQRLAKRLAKRVAQVAELEAQCELSKARLYQSASFLLQEGYKYDVVSLITGLSIMRIRLIQQENQANYRPTVAQYKATKTHNNILCVL